MFIRPAGTGHFCARKQSPHPSQQQMETGLPSQVCANRTDHPSSRSSGSAHTASQTPTTQEFWEEPNPAKGRTGVASSSTGRGAAQNPKGMFPTVLLKALQDHSSLPGKHAKQLKPWKDPILPPCSQRHPLRNNEQAKEVFSKHKLKSY